MSAQRRTVEFEADADRPDLRHSIDSLYAGADSGSTFHRREATANEKVVRPPVFAKEAAGPEPVGNRDHAIGAVRTIMKAAELSRQVGAEAERRASQAADIARRALQQLETASVTLAATQSDLRNAHEKAHQDKIHADEKIASLFAENQELTDRMSRLDREFESVARMYKEIKDELIRAREKIIAAETRANEAENELRYVTDFASEAFKSN